MIHYINGKLIPSNSTKYIVKNAYFGIEVIYNGTKKEGEFFLFPYFDQNNNTYFYYAFDSLNQKVLFEQINKIPGVGPKTSYTISIIDENKLKEAINNSDLKIFENIPGVGQKTAKRIILELKNNLENFDFNKNNKEYEKIIKTMKNYGFEKKDIESLIKDCPYEISENNFQYIIKWILKNLK